MNIEKEYTAEEIEWSNLNKIGNHLTNAEGVSGFHATPVIRALSNMQKEIDKLKQDNNLLSKNLQEIINLLKPFVNDNLIEEEIIAIEKWYHNQKKHDETI